LPYFSCLVCCDDTIPAKPEPTSYLIACERLQADPQCSVAVEDSPHGVAAASTAGLFTVAVPHALTEGLNFASADIVLTSLEELTLNLALSMAERHSPGRVRPDEV
jgi:putative hydrolase of the HAD superfamily